MASTHLKAQWVFTQDIFIAACQACSVGEVLREGVAEKIAMWEVANIYYAAHLSAVK